MVKKLIISLFLVLLAVGLQAQQKAVILKSQITDIREGKRFYIHTVAAGQTVYSIAKAYEVSTDEIFFENPGSNNGISVGQQLWIPVISKEKELKSELKSADFDFFYHIVKKNETLRSIAGEYHLPEDFIKRANPGVSDPLREGLYLKIPAEMAHDRRRDNSNEETDETVSFDPSIAVIPDFRHVVKSGETTQSIAGQYHVDVHQLKAVNVGLGNTVTPGDRLRIPQEKKKEIKQEFITYKVKKKETLYSISRQYGLTVQDLMEANKGLTTSIKTGQVIRIPKKVVTDEYLTYAVTSKTKLNKLAKLYRIPVSEITDANPGIGKRLYPGVSVKIPVGDKTITSVEEVAEEDVVPEEEVAGEAPGSIFRKDCHKHLKPDTKRVFKIALMVPLYLEEMDSLDVTQFLQSEHDDFGPFRFIKFYEGALLAVDSLQKQGMKVDLYVYDVDQSITKTTRAMQNSELRHMDLIIGPFFSRSFDQVALFAGNFGIPIINPLSFREEITHKYHTVIKVKPGEEYQPELVQKLLQTDYSGAQVFLISQSAYKAADKIVELQNVIRETIPNNVAVSNRKLYEIGVGVAQRNENYNKSYPVPVFKVEGQELYPDILSTDPDGTTLFANHLTKINYSVDSLHPFHRKASAARKNVVILYGDNKAFVMDVMNRLNQYRDTFDIQLVGLPVWERFSGLNQTLCSNMKLTYFSSSYVDYEQENVQDLAYKFRKKFKTDPGQMGFTGFDVTYYFLHALLYLGNRFDACLPEYPMTMTHNTYHFEQTARGKNFENTSWNILRYRDLRLIKLNPGY